jgi:hypothetical protein
VNTTPADGSQAIWADDDDPRTCRDTGPALAGGPVSAPVPDWTRMWNYWLGGKDHYPADRQAADQYTGLFPGAVTVARSCRYFTARVVRYLAGEAGIRDFLDIGTGLPLADPVHEIAQRAAPDDVVFVSYADNDPLVLAHARALLTGPPGTTGHIDADLNDPATLLAIARTQLGFTRPAAILLMTTLGHIGDPADDDQAARAVVTALKDALLPGGYLAICDLTSTDPAQDNALAQFNQVGAVRYRARSPEQIIRLLDGLELISPGVVPVHLWRPDPGPFPSPEVPAWGAVAVKQRSSQPPGPGPVTREPEVRS